MANPLRPLLRMKGHELVPAEEDRLVEIAVYDALLPCRRFEIAYKVAVLGSLSPSLEFLLRLVKAAPGIEEEDAAAFFGYSQSEMTYALEEALGPGYLERNDHRLWLTLAGEQLFAASGDEPLIYSVESRRRSYGFDLFSVSPQPPRRLEEVEFALPELPISDPRSSGNVSDKLKERFRRFFYELSDRADKEQSKRRDLYSIDAILPKDRFPVPVRIRAFVQASSPHLIEKVDLTSWRPEADLTDRSEVEDAAFRLADSTKTSANQMQATAAYDVLLELAPEFFSEFTNKDGLSVRRYWREAVGRAGEVRKDRKTIALVGALTLEDNISRLAQVLDYGEKNASSVPSCAIFVAPQVPHWGATTLLSDLISLVRRKATASSSEPSEFKSTCLFAGNPERYIKKTFDRVGCSEGSEFPPALELFLIPQIMVAAVVHAPIGSPNGYAAPLGMASFDRVVVERAQQLIGERLDRFGLTDHEIDDLDRSFGSSLEMADEHE